MYFIDRYDAAMQLAPLLEKYREEKGVILAVPRGGIPLGYYLARHFGFPLDLLMAKKLGHPGNKEFAIGAVSTEESIVEETRGVPEQYIEEETQRIREQLKKRYKKFMGDREPIDIKGKIVIVVDDGIATGRTILSTIKLLRKKEPEKIVVAVPVSSGEAAKRIKEVVDDFICLHTPYPFYGVGNFYDDFSQVEDEEVLQFLNELNDRKKVV